MRRVLLACLWLMGGLSLLVSAGCNAAIQALLIDQGIGFLSAISAAATTSLIQQWFGPQG